MTATTLAILASFALSGCSFVKHLVASPTVTITATPKPKPKPATPLVKLRAGYHRFSRSIAFTTSRGHCQEDGFQDWNCYAVKVISSVHCPTITVDLNTLNHQYEITGNDSLEISNVGANRVARLEGGNALPGESPPHIAVSSITCGKD
jgi:hypothetical protein